MRTDGSTLEFNYGSQGPLARKVYRGTIRIDLNSYVFCY